MKRSKFIVIAAPSGSGKTTIVNKLLNEKNLGLSFSISATSREPRKNEKDGENYFFISKEEFLRRLIMMNFLNGRKSTRECFMVHYFLNLKMQKKKI